MNEHPVTGVNFDGLRRWPDLESAELKAWDTADALILDEAAELLPGARIVVIGDEYGALTLGALQRGAVSVRVHQDRLSGELALRANSAAAHNAVAQNSTPHNSTPHNSTPLNSTPHNSAPTAAGYESLALVADLVADATIVLLRLPRSLDALNEIAALIAAHATPEVVVIAGGRIKHMTVSMNGVLARYFSRVDVSHARQKSRALIARQPISLPDSTSTTASATTVASARGLDPVPRRTFHPDLGLWIVATGGVFAGASIDIGTRALLRVLDRVAPFESAVDLGCGSGILAAALARDHPSARVLATDESASAVASTILTMQENALSVTVTRDDAASTVADRSVDLVVLNPPFHTGAAVHSGVSRKLFEAASRILRPGGELWTVFNSHLDYGQSLQRIIGATRQIERTPKFTVTVSRKR